MSAADRITDAVQAVLHAGPADQGRPWPPGWCEECGAVDGDVLTLVHPVDGTTVEAHPECGERRGYQVTPPCTGAPDLCGAAAGRPCEPGCPGAASDPEADR